MTRVHLAGCYETACARHCIAKLTPTIKCAAASIIQANRVEVMHVWSKRMLQPASTHNFQTFQSNTTRISDNVSCFHFSQGKHSIFIFHPASPSKRNHQCLMTKVSQDWPVGLGQYCPRLSRSSAELRRTLH